MKTSLRILKIALGYKYFNLLRSVERSKHMLSLNENDFFRDTFKYYKHRKKPSELLGVIDFESRTLPESAELFENCTVTDANDNNVELGLLPGNQWRVYTLKGFGGFIYVKNPFTVAGQQRWIKKCLELYARKPSVTNLDRHHKSVDDIWTLRRDEDPLKRKLIDRLTWATQGYHYNWDDKVYNRANYTPFPECLAKLAKYVANSLNFGSFHPESAIVNYYHRKSTLGIHNDQAEDYLREPILSFSFGQSAVFLLGTGEKTDKPVPLILRSGDIVVLSGECRTSYHAVPSIIEEAVDDRFCSTSSGGGEESWLPFHEYIKDHRINISVRQVYEASVMP